MIPAQIIYPKDGEIRARKVALRSNYKHVVKFASKKCNKTLYLESPVEHDRCRILEVNPMVKRFNEQPFKILYLDEGSWKKMFPDLLVWLYNGPCRVEEITTVGKSVLPEYKRRFEIEKQILNQFGFQFNVYTDQEIRSGYLLKNAEKLLPYRRSNVGLYMRERVESLLVKSRETISSLISKIEGLTETDVFTLLVFGLIIADLTTPLVAETVVSLNFARKNENIFENGECRRVSSKRG